MLIFCLSANISIFPLSSKNEFKLEYFNLSILLFMYFSLKNVSKYLTLTAMAINKKELSY